jgi:DNA-binding MarR family transcriptional regulator
MTSLVTQLEKMGLAERQRHSGDGRVVLVAITSGGREYLESKRGVGVSRFSALIDKLAPHEVDALGAALRPLRHLLYVAEESGGGSRPVRATSSVANGR